MTVLQELNEIKGFLLIPHYYHYCMNDKCEFTCQTAVEVISQMQSR
jgi:hypothetical protein